jgi:hypothetical protein
MWTEKTLPKYILFIPFIWSIIGFFAALNFGIYADIGLLVIGLTAFILLIIRDTGRTGSSDAGTTAEIS